MLGTIMSQRQMQIVAKAVYAAIGLAVLAALFWISTYKHLFPLFHAMAEVFAISVELALFLIVWNSRRYMDNGYLLAVGIALGSMAILDVLHVVAYHGMNVFPGNSANYATELWIAGRYVQATAMLLAPLALWRKPNVHALLAAWAVVVGLLIASIFYWNVFPDCYVGEQTPFKIRSEYAISAALAASIVILLLSRRHFDRRVLWTLVASLTISIASELAFTKYAQVFDSANAVGHLLRIVAFYLLYRALVETALRRPYALLFRNYVRGQESLKRIEWLLTRNRGVSRQTLLIHRPSVAASARGQASGVHMLIDSVGEEALADVANEFIGLLETSVAIWEQTGEYALGIVASPWCQELDRASRALAGTDNDADAMRCGKWLCHEACWARSGKVATETGEPVDVECYGGLRLYAVPIRARGRIIGAISFGYGDPPKDAATLRRISEDYRIPAERLRHLAAAYESRPPFIVEVAKSRLQSAARLLGTIAEREEALLELGNEQARLRTIIESAPEGIVVLDSRGRTVMINPAAERLYEYCPGPGEPWHPTEPRICHPDGTPYEPRNLPVVQAALDGRTQMNLEVTFIWANGERMDALENVAPIRDGAGRLTGAIGIIQDISGQHAFRAELTRRAEQLERLIQEAHHRIRNNLQSVISLLELERNHVDPSGEASLDRCVGRIRAIAMVHRLLTTHATSSVPLASLLKGLSELAKATSLEYGETAINISVGGRNPDINSKTATSLAIVVNELIANAIEHAFVGREKGEISLAVREATNGDLMLTVTDNGVGCPDSVRAGTGLSLVRTIVEHDMKGEFAMANDNGGGCEAVVRLKMEGVRP